MRFKTTPSDGGSVNSTWNKELRAKIRLSVWSLRYIPDTFKATATKLEARMKNN